MERNSAPGWRHGDESYRRKLHSRRGNDDDAKTKGACDFLLPIQTSQKMVSTDDGWLLFSTKKNPKGSLPLTRNHTISSAACLRVFFVFCYRALCDVIWQFHSTFPFLIFYFFSFLFAQIWQPWRRNTCRIICAIFRLTNDDETWSRSKSRPISDCSAVASNE